MSELQLRNNSFQDLNSAASIERPRRNRPEPDHDEPEDAVSVDLDQPISASGAPNLVGTYGSAGVRNTRIANGDWTAFLDLNATQVNVPAGCTQ